MSFLLNFRWYIFDLCTKVYIYFTIIFLPLKESETLFQIWIFLLNCYLTCSISVIKDKIIQMHSKYFNEKCDDSIFPGLSILFLHATDHKAWFLKSLSLS